MKDCVLFFVKYPEPGQVKTRLATDSSPELAADFYKGFVEEKLSELEVGVRGDLLVFFAPEQMKTPMGEWLGPGRRLRGQKGIGLGRRMENGFREVFHMGYERAVLVGSDIPGLTPDIINSGLAALTPERAAFGPAGDGGYYLIGFHRNGFFPEVFKGEEWSDSAVFQRAFNLITGSGLKFTELDRLDDMDTIEDIETMLALGPAGPLRGRTLDLARKLIGR